ncbi:HipA family kinase [Candidatus Frankia alpina]|uniref:HipA family kinase n=1 Tax=Candidatus Frankia alpina TaxID=2699483 RepID=UPI0013D7DF6A|nr:HipA family kinase [Candidatus Frankia alpina]
MLRHVTAVRYATPLREGGSLPGLMEGDDLGTWVVKFSGAGQGPKALVAEVIVGELARELGLAVPELVLIDVDPELGRTEPDQEVQDLLRASAGLNLGMDYLPGSITYDPLAFDATPETAARVLWLDVLTLNVDRSWRNPNLLVWGGRLWLIDHGAALYPHHDWAGAAAAVGRVLPGIADHVVLPVVAAEPATFAAADAALAPRIDAELLTAVVARVPDAWLDVSRADYVSWLLARVAARASWRDAVTAAVAEARPAAEVAPGARVAAAIASHRHGAGSAGPGGAVGSSGAVGPGGAGAAGSGRPDWLRAGDWLRTGGAAAAENRDA